MAIDKELWEEWFDKQYDLVQRIDRAVDGIVGKFEIKPIHHNAARAALYAAVLEHCADKIRTEIDLYRVDVGAGYWTRS